MTAVGSPLLDIRFTGAGDGLEAAQIDLVTQIQRYLDESNPHPDAWRLYLAPFGWGSTLNKIEAGITLMDLDGDEPPEDHGQWYYHEIVTKERYTRSCMMEALMQATEFMRKHGLDEDDCRVLTILQSSGLDNNQNHGHMYVFYCAPEKIEVPEGD